MLLTHRRRTIGSSIPDPGLLLQVHALRLRHHLRAQVGDRRALRLPRRGVEHRLGRVQGLPRRYRGGRRERAADQRLRGIRVLAPRHPKVQGERD